MIPDHKDGDPMSLTAFLSNVISYNTANPRQRPGQALFNVLYMVRPDLSEQIRATELDPFHSMEFEQINQTIVWIWNHWDDEVPQ